jgi:hypothetical protein
VSRFTFGISSVLMLARFGSARVRSMLLRCANPTRYCSAHLVWLPWNPYGRSIQTINAGECECSESGLLFRDAAARLRSRTECRVYTLPSLSH